MAKKAAARKTSRKVATLGSKAMREPATVSDDEVQSLGASVVSQAEIVSEPEPVPEPVPPSLVASENKSPPDQSWRSRNRLT